MTHGKIASLVMGIPKSVTPTANASAADLAPQPQKLLTSPLEKLPAECGTLGLSNMNMVIICHQTKESILDKLINTAPSLSISLIAIFLSVYSFSYTKRKDKNARLHSVQDDFWLRKIVSPASIEPFFKLSSQVINTLPSSDYSLDSIREWHREHHATLLKLKPEFQALDLLSSSLFEAVDLELEKFEDTLAEYMDEIFEHVKNGKAPPLKAHTTAKLASVRHNLLHLILAHQVNLGSTKS